MDNLNIEALGDRLFVQSINIEETSKGGLIMYKDNNTKQFFYGKIISAGNGKTLDNGTKIEMRCKEGDVIIYNPNSAFDLEVNGITYHVIRDSEAIGKVKNI